MTQKRFSATQYALFTSLFALPRLLAGPIAGVAVDAMGWSTFFLSTLVMGVPGLVMLQRFVPMGTRDPVFTVDDVSHGPALGRAQIAARGVAGARAARRVRLRARRDAAGHQDHARDQGRLRSRRPRC